MSAIYEQASRLALSSQDCLSLLKRIHLRKTPALFAEHAAQAVNKLPLNESVARVAVRAFIDGGRFQEALRLFPDPLNPSEFPSLYAEAMIAYLESLPDESGLASRRFDSGPAIDELALGFLFKESGEPRAAFDAALLCLARGDLPGARSYASAAMDSGYVLDAELSWDLGFLERVLESPPLSDAGSLCRYADACMMTGRKKLAQTMYLQVVTEYPRYSWVPYVVLARFEPDRDRADLWIDALMRHFGENKAAFQAASAYYAGKGEAAKALAIIKPLSGKDYGSGALELAVLDMLESKERLVSSTLVFAGRFPREALAADFAALMLERNGRFDEAVQVFNRARKNSLIVPRAYFHQAIAALLVNDYGEAISQLERGGAAEGGFAPLYDVGIVHTAAANYGKAAERLEVAAVNAPDPVNASKAFVALAKARQLLGDQKGARAALQAALDANPLSGEASFLLGKE